jgi:spoIIIJ-associated protein
MNREESIRFATKYLEDLLSFFGVNLAVRSTADEDVIELQVPSSELNSLLIGKNADNLRALQTVVSMTLASHEAELTRVNIDIADYKKQHSERIERQAEEWIRRVRETGNPMTLNLNPADRRTVHKFAEDYYDITTYSEGEGRERHLVIAKKDTTTAEE